MNRQRVNHDRRTLLGGHVAETLNENEVDNRLMIREPRVDRNIDVVGLHRDRRRHHAVKRGEHLLSLWCEYLRCLLVSLWWLPIAWLSVLLRYLGILKICIFLLKRSCPFLLLRLDLTRMVLMIVRIIWTSYRLSGVGCAAHSLDRSLMNNIRGRAHLIA